MKTYKYGDWDFEWVDTAIGRGFDDRLYIDDDGNPITGILEGFYGYGGLTSDDKNCQYVENGKRK